MQAAIRDEMARLRLEDSQVERALAEKRRRAPVASQEAPAAPAENGARKPGQQVKRTEVYELVRALGRPVTTAEVRKMLTERGQYATSPSVRNHLVARAGHSDFKTTQGYIDLAGETFREDADLLERRLWGLSGTKNRYQVEDPSPVEATTE
jgi:hypothetical protein